MDVVETIGLGWRILPLNDAIVVGFVWLTLLASGLATRGYRRRVLRMELDHWAEHAQITRDTAAIKTATEQIQRIVERNHA